VEPVALRSWLYFCLVFLLIPLFLNLIRLTLIVFRGPRGWQVLAHHEYEERASRAIREMMITCLVIIIVFLFGLMAF